MVTLRRLSLEGVPAALEMAQRYRLLNEPVPDGPSKGYTSNLEPMLDEYFSFRGWNNDGIPSESKLEELGLSDLI